MKLVRSLLFVIATVALTARGAEPAAPYLRPLIGPPVSGWQRITLDSAAQRDVASVWLGDAEGQPVPFLRESELPRTEQSVVVGRWFTGRTEEGMWTAEFDLELPSNAQATALNSPGVLNLNFEINSKEPWIAEAEIFRRSKGGEWIKLAEQKHVYGFDSRHRSTSLRAPRDAQNWRVHLRMLQGEIRELRSISVTSAPDWGTLTAPRTVAATVKNTGGKWQLTLPEPLRIVAWDLELHGTVAPVTAEISVVQKSPGGEATDVPVGRGQIWRMPGLATSETHVRLDAAALGDSFTIALPAGVTLVGAKASVREEQLWFVGEAGTRYALHFGGMAKRAAGNLGELPTALTAGAMPPRELGPAEPDPFGKILQPSALDRLRQLLPWVVLLLIAGLAVVAWRLMRRGQSAS